MTRSLSLLIVLVLCCSVQTSHAASELRIFYTYGEVTLGKILNDFSKETGIKVQIEFRQQGDLKSGMAVMMEMNQAPDAIIMPADHAGMYRLIKYSAVDARLFTSHIPDRIWQSGKSDGTIYGAPIIQGNHLVLYYNKALVKEPAKDWKDLFVQKKELEAKGLSPIAWSYDEPYWLLPFVGAYGGWPVSRGKVELNTPAMISAITFYRGLRDQKMPYPNSSYGDAVKLFETEKVAYTINGEWAGHEFAEKLGDKLGVAALPMAEGHKMVPTFSTHIIAAPNDGLNGPKRAEIIQLINFLQSPRVQREIWDKVGAIPVEPSAFAYAQQNAKGYLKQTLELMTETRSLDSDQSTSFIWDAIGKGFIRYREGAMTAPESAEYMQQLAERHIRNAQREAQQEAPNP